MAPRGGIARYFAEIIPRLPGNTQPNVLLSEQAQLTFGHPGMCTQRANVRPPLKMLGRFWRPRQFPRLTKQMAGMQCDLTHWTYYCGLAFRPIPSTAGPNIVTVYDFIYEHFPEFDIKGRHRAWQRQSIGAADHIFCISNTTYDELCERYPSAAKRSSVTPLGNSFADVELETIPQGLRDQPFILFVGTRSGYKNFRLLWDAWKIARMEVPELSLVAVGPPLKRKEKKTLGLDSESCDGFIPLGRVSDGLLKGLYQECQAFVFPSRMEGFGLPAVEAMESGAIVLASDCPTFKEVCGDVGFYFDPSDANQCADLLVAAVGEMLGDRQEIARKSKQRARKFKWEETVCKTVEVYRQFAKSVS